MDRMSCLDRNVFCTYLFDLRSIGQDGHPTKIFLYLQKTTFIANEQAVNLGCKGSLKIRSKFSFTFNSKLTFLTSLTSFTSAS